MTRQTFFDALTATLRTAVVYSGGHDIEPVSHIRPVESSLVVLLLQSSAAMRLTISFHEQHCR